MISTRYQCAMTAPDQINALITRLARLEAAATWDSDLNPAQVAALDYLFRANRFSRAPSHVADYLGTTRGTMSQTLKVLARKGYLAERQSSTDRRSITYDPTASGIDRAKRAPGLVHAIAGLPAEDQSRLRSLLSAVLREQLAANGGRAFGLCKSCTHHRTTREGAFCALLSLPLAPEETGQICHEQVPA